MHQERFLDLISVLEAVPEEKFDMHQWTNNCKTVGCAIGHYCFSNPNIELKLIYRRTYDSLIPVFGDLNNYAAIAAYFNITLRETSYLFCNLSYRLISPLQEIPKTVVLSRLLKFYNKKCINQEEMQLEETVNAS